MAVAAARLGADARFLGKIGRDRYGEAFLELLREEGVREEHVLYAETTPTATGFIISCTDGRNIIVTDRGANGDFSPEDIALHSDAITQADVIVSPLEIPLDTALAAARVAHAHGVSAILNPAPRRRFAQPRRAMRFLRLLRTKEKRAFVWACHILAF